MYKILILSICAVVGLNTDVYANNTNSVDISVLKLENLSSSAQKCFLKANKKGFASTIGAVNNNGIVAGSMEFISRNSLGISSCKEKAFLWDDNHSQRELPNFSTGIKTKVMGANVASLSSNLVLSGITFTDKLGLKTEAATMYKNNNAFEIKGKNFAFSVSENGKYIVGSNIAGQAYILDTIRNNVFEVSDTQEKASQATLNSISNDGYAVGATDMVENNKALFCNYNSKKCTELKPKKDSENSTFFASSISPNGEYIYGSLNGNDLSFVKFNKQGNDYKIILKGYYIEASQKVTNNGVTIVADNTNEHYLYVPGKKSYLFSVRNLENKLSLPSNTSIKSISMSPSGEYLVFDVSDFGNDNSFAVKVHFSEGVDIYLKNNLKPTLEI